MLNDADLFKLLRHDAIEPAVSLAIVAEIDYGLAKDARVLLIAAVEGVVEAQLPDYRRVTKLKPLDAARVLAKDPIVGKRLWSPAEQEKLLARIDEQSDLPKLLLYWTAARTAYRLREKKSSNHS